MWALSTTRGTNLGWFTSPYQHLEWQWSQCAYSGLINHILPWENSISQSRMPLQDSKIQNAYKQNFGIAGTKLLYKLWKQSRFLAAIKHPHMLQWTKRDIHVSKPKPRRLEWAEEKYDQLLFPTNVWDIGFMAEKFSNRSLALWQHLLLRYPKIVPIRNLGFGRIVSNNISVKVSLKH